MPIYGISSRIEKENELLVEKIFEVPREHLFEMFTETRHLKSFWGPRGWELVHSSMNFEDEGEWFYGLQDLERVTENQQMTSWGLTVFKEIFVPERIAYIDYFTDKSGEINRELPVAKGVMTFEELDDNRSILKSHTEYQSAEELQRLVDVGLLQGVAETWDRLSEYLNEIK